MRACVYACVRICGVERIRKKNEKQRIPPAHVAAAGGKRAPFVRSALKRSPPKLPPTNQHADCCRRSVPLSSFPIFARARAPRTPGAYCRTCYAPTARSGTAAVTRHSTGEEAQEGSSSSERHSDSKLQSRRVYLWHTGRNDTPTDEHADRHRTNSEVSSAARYCVVPRVCRGGYREGETGVPQGAALLPVLFVGLADAGCVCRAAARSCGLLNTHEPW